MAYLPLVPGLPQSLVNLLGIAGAIVLLLVVVALGGIAYKALVAGGIEWPEDVEDEEGVSRGGSDDEWKYY